MKYKCPKCGMVVQLEERRLSPLGKVVMRHLFFLSEDNKVKVLCPEMFDIRRTKKLK